MEQIELLNLQMTAPLPPQFRQTALSIPSNAIALLSDIELPVTFINATAEPKQVRHQRRGIDLFKP